ncbi:TonB-dependent receptor [Methylobacterium radiotolerans]|uniref:TonB-dependent receptor n=1 Tax=Methylobacterium radiotolerans (strain ATCC 27329 / DSM 1819 / JCM 2831 / NBRC 15690 / NCIMB 10815 / 0-1) TaxID=426355 RepID=B1M287_METRJ|nr:TonB-dependent receptor [Methylobacterium radiotolerans]ACB24698.1 TonB-dependent receptor [Methylobacterium radiotolerans JCM 2831]GEM97028.1 membrane protein [Methylobacterium radiotolerans]
MSLRALRSSLVASASVLAGTVLPAAVQAQQSVTLGEISVVSTSPVGAGGGSSSQAQIFNGSGPVPPAGSVGPSAGVRLRGSEQPLYKIPSTVESVTASDLTIDRASDNLTTTLARRTPGINVSDSQGNNNRVDITYRGFTASPVQGVPQGLAVYQNGVRINEAFGDIVNFDLIPPQAIQRIDVVTGNPVFGLNALGGAVNIQMKNGFTWQGTEISAWGGSDARTAGYLEYGKVSGPWSVYFTGDGLNDRGWRYESPSTIGRLYGDIGYRSQDSEFHLIGLAARSFYGAAAATPVDFTHRDPRAIFTYPQTTTTEVGTLQLTGRVDISPTWDLAGNAYFRRFSQTYVDGNDGNFENCSTRSSFRGNLCFEDDGFSPAAGQSQTAFRNQFLILGQQNQRIPFRSGIPYGTLDTTRTEATGFGGSLQAANRDRIFGLSNSFVVGGSIDAANYGFKSSSTLGVINPNLSITTDPSNPFYGNIPGLGTPQLRTAGALGIAPSSVNGSNLYMGLYTLDTLDVTDRLSLTAGARLNFARIQSEDLTGFSPDVTGTHYFNKINPVAGLTYRFFDALNLYGSYSESNRAPTPLELACANPDRPCLLPNSLVADPPLKQVTGRTYEVGFRGQLPNTYDGGIITYKIGAFRTDLANDILSLATPGNTARAYFVNVPSTQRQGIEVGGEYTADYLRVYANYALVDATFQFNGTLSSPNNPLADDGAIQVRKGNVVPLVPTHQIKAGFDYFVTPDWQFGLYLQAFSSSYFRGDESNLNRKLPPYYVLNFQTKYQVTKNLEVFGLITNLTNNRYATFGTFAEPGAVAGNLRISDPRTTTLAQPFSVYAGIRYAFGADPVPMSPEPIIRKY